MPNKTYTNQINEMEVSLAIERLLIANYPNPFTPARVNLSSLPSGFHDLGAVVEDTPSFSAGRTKFTLEAGLPMIRQYEAVIGVNGTFEVQLHSNSWRKVQYALGNWSAVSSATLLSTIASVTDKSVITLTSTPTSPVAVGDQVVVAATAAGFDDPDADECKISSINGLTLHLNPSPANTPAANSVLGRYDFVRQAIGGSGVKYYALLGVADFIDGVQVVHSMPKVAPAEAFTEEIRPAQNERIPLTFNAFGQISSAYGTSDELIVAERFFFPAKG